MAPARPRLSQSDMTPVFKSNTQAKLFACSGAQMKNRPKAELICAPGGNFSSYRRCLGCMIFSYRKSRQPFRIPHVREFRSLHDQYPMQIFLFALWLQKYLALASNPSRRQNITKPKACLGFDILCAGRDSKSTTSVQVV